MHFTGDERDTEDNLDHTWFRQYSSTLGRWMTPDPAGLAAADPGNPQSWNRYAYVADDPIDSTDALGLIICNICPPTQPSPPPPPPQPPPRDPNWLLQQPFDPTDINIHTCFPELFGTNMIAWGAAAFGFCLPARPPRTQRHRCFVTLLRQTMEEKSAAGQFELSRETRQP